MSTRKTSGTAVNNKVNDRVTQSIKDASDKFCKDHGLGDTQVWVAPSKYQQVTGKHIRLVHKHDRCARAKMNFQISTDFMEHYNENHNNPDYEYSIHLLTGFQECSCILQNKRSLVDATEEEIRQAKREDQDKFHKANPDAYDRQLQQQRTNYAEMRKNPEVVQQDRINSKNYEKTYPRKIYNLKRNSGSFENANTMNSTLPKQLVPCTEPLIFDYDNESSNDNSDSDSSNTSTSSNTLTEILDDDDDKISKTLITTTSSLKNPTNGVSTTAKPSSKHVRPSVIAKRWRRKERRRWERQDGNFELSSKRMLDEYYIRKPNSTITLAEFQELIKKGCTYCAECTAYTCDCKDKIVTEFGATCKQHKSYFGIDRIENNIPDYHKHNSVCSCWSCNSMKGEKTSKQFFHACENVARAHPAICAMLLPEWSNVYCHGEGKCKGKNCKGDTDDCGKLRKRQLEDEKGNNINCLPRTIEQIKSCAQRLNVEYTLQAKDIYDCKIASCRYCKVHPPGGCGVDRIDSTVGYVQGNYVACCHTCNMMKNINSEQVFIVLCCMITLRRHHAIDNKINITDTNPMTFKNGFALATYADKTQSAHHKIRMADQSHRLERELAIRELNQDIIEIPLSNFNGVYYGNADTYVHAHSECGLNANMKYKEYDPVTDEPCKKCLRQTMQGTLCLYYNYTMSTHVLPNCNQELMLVKLVDFRRFTNELFGSDQRHSEKSISACMNCGNTNCLGTEYDKETHGTTKTKTKLVPVSLIKQEQSEKQQKRKIIQEFKENAKDCQRAFVDPDIEKNLNNLETIKRKLVYHSSAICSSGACSDGKYCLVAINTKTYPDAFNKLQQCIHCYAKPVVKHNNENIDSIKEQTPIPKHHVYHFGKSCSYHTNKLCRGLDAASKMDLVNINELYQQFGPVELCALCNNISEIPLDERRRIENAKHYKLNANKLKEVRDEKKANQTEEQKKQTKANNAKQKRQKRRAGTEEEKEQRRAIESAARKARRQKAKIGVKRKQEIESDEDVDDDEPPTKKQK